MPPKSARKSKSNRKMGKSLKAVEREKSYLKDHFPLLSLMSKMSPEQCNALMPYVKENTHHALCTCAHNALVNFSKFTPEQVQNIKSTLSPNIDQYRYLSSEMNAKSKKRLHQRADVINQVGSGFPLILSAVLPLLGSLLFGK
jgi:hypothetical protein